MFRGDSLLALLLAAASASAGDALPHLNILPGSLTVSGVSSGGYMATQYQVAYAKDVIGAGIVAAGPWFCAQNSLFRALDDCMKGGTIGPDVAPLVAAARQTAKAGFIDDPSWIVPDRVFVFHGSRDQTVGAAVTDSLVRFYRAFIPPERIHYETRVAAAHGFPAQGQGVACDMAAPPWINDCDYDAAGELLRYFYDDLREPTGKSRGELQVFDQRRYATAGALSSLEDSGWVYVPKDCTAGRPCRVHVAFHGCRQGSGFVGMAFVRNAGYNRWAEANRIVVLYPQASKSWFWPFNPQGCWDWWGYTGANYATRDGAQLSSIHRMLRALGTR
jgi:poly(3-hydroxybutyrate) depolymerase